ncbi:hypothetical protein DYH09_23110 [bacterium CPR1]|nr:hypothetical protein [bacterium CPR1]
MGRPPGGPGRLARGDRLPQGVHLLNVAELLDRATALNPDGRALIYRRQGRWQELSFTELLDLCRHYTGTLRELGLERGQRALMMVPNGPEFVALTFAVFRVGALPVLIDPGMGLKPMLRCIEHARPDFLIGIRKAHLLRTVFRSPFASVRQAISVDGAFPGAHRLTAQGPRVVDLANTHQDEPAAILFTSGSTGPAKGVVYRHGIFQTQVACLRDTFGFQAGEIDLPGFPLFALFSTALGLTCVLRELNPSRPATCDPVKIVRAIQEFGVNNLQGSPAIWTRVGRWCEQHCVRLPSLKRLLTFGAPIPPALMARWADIMPPEAAGAGTCVGRPLPGVELAILAITDEAIPEWREDLVLPAGEYGEVAVAGPMVTWEYDGLSEETRRSKIRQGDRIWHRMGDMGYRDEQGRVWLLGRKSHRVEGRVRYYPEQAEGMVNPHPLVARSALVGVGERGAQAPVLVVEPEPEALKYDRRRQEELAGTLRRILSEHPVYRDVERVLYHPAFPVDPRHNAKIHREELAAWASKRS